MLNALTIDLEDWFHILDVEAAPTIKAWRSFESRVERNTGILLSILRHRQVRATFFVLGWIAEVYPELVRQIASEGHEIASHGYGHKLVYASGREEFEEDIVRSQAAIRAAAGVSVRGYRAPGFSINQSCLWAFDVLAKHDFMYDSSIFPSFRDHGGFYSYSTKITRQRCSDGSDLWEFPISVYSILGLRIPFCGGGYFRLCPLRWMQCGIQKLNQEGLPVVVYLHPRDLDASQPRLRMPLKRSWKCYFNLAGTEHKLDQLLERFKFGPMLDVLCQHFRGKGQEIEVERGGAEPKMLLRGQAVSVT